MVPMISTEILLDGGRKSRPHVRSKVELALPRDTLRTVLVRAGQSMARVPAVGTEMVVEEGVVVVGVLVITGVLMEAV